MGRSVLRDFRRHRGDLFCEGAGEIGRSIFARVDELSRNLKHNVSSSPVQMKIIDQLLVPLIYGHTLCPDSSHVVQNSLAILQKMLESVYPALD